MKVVGALAAAGLLAAALAVAPAAAAPRTQNLSITIRAGDRIVEPNFALAAGVPVHLTVHNFTHEFHTFTIAKLGVSALIRPSQATSITFTPQAVGTFAWRCVICPSGQHGHAHAMEGALYLIVDPSAVG